MGVFIQLFVIGVLCLQDSFSDMGTYKAGMVHEHQINSYPHLIKEGSNLNVENLMLPSLKTVADDADEKIAQKVLQAASENAESEESLSAEFTCNRTKDCTFQTSLYGSFAADLQAWISYIWNRLCIISFVVSVYFLEMM